MLDKKYDNCAVIYGSVAQWWVKSSKNAAVQIRCEGLGGITFVFSGEMHLHEVCISRDKFIQNMDNENNMDLSLTFV